MNADYQNDSLEYISQPSVLMKMAQSIPAGGDQRNEMLEVLI